MNFKKWPFLICITLGCSIGMIFGTGIYTFIYGRGLSYLSNDPRACINCHVMRDQYHSWMSSSHHRVAVCNDCHTPGNLFQKYASKLSNGYHHSLAFTTQRFHEPIQIKESNQNSVEKSCRSCHSTLLKSSGLTKLAHTENGISCTRCHGSVGHAK